MHQILTYLGGSSDRLLDPLLLVEVSLIDHLKRGDVYIQRFNVKISVECQERHTRIEIVCDQIVIRLSNRVQESGIE